MTVRVLEHVRVHVHVLVIVLVLVLVSVSSAHADPPTPLFTAAAVRHDDAHVAFVADVARATRARGVYVSGVGLGLELADGLVDLDLVYRDLRTSAESDWVIALRGGLVGYLDARHRLALAIHGELGAGDTGSLLRVEAGVVFGLGDHLALTLAGGLADTSLRSVSGRFPIVTLAVTVRP